MREWLKRVSNLVFGTGQTVAKIANKLADALHEIPYGAVSATLTKADEITCDAIDGVFDAVKGVKENTPE